MQRILVNAGAGYVGQVLVRELLKNKFVVTVIDRFIFINKKSFPNNKLLTVIKDDVRKINSSFYKNIDIVIDLTNVSISPIGNKFYDKLTWEINYKTRKKNIILAKKNGVKKYLYPSSCSVYGYSRNKKLLTERSILDPKSTYAKAQVKLEKFAIKQGNKNFCIAILRLPTVFGISKRTRYDVIINALVLDALEYGKINLLRDGKQRRPFIHIKDVSRAFLFFISCNSEIINNQIFNIGDEINNITLLDLTKLIFKTLKLKKKILWYGSSDDRSYFVSFKKVKSIGFFSKYKITDGIRELAKAFQDGKTTRSIQTYNIKWLDKLEHLNKLDKQNKLKDENTAIIKKFHDIKMYGGILNIK